MRKEAKYSQKVGEIKKGETVVAERVEIDHSGTKRIFVVVPSDTKRKGYPYVSML